MRRLSVAFALLSLFALAGPVSAVEVSQEDVRELTLEETDCVGVTVSPCTRTTLFVVDREDEVGSQVCLFILTLEPLDETTALVLAEETGCAPIDPADFVFGNRQSSATLAPTSIDLTYCDNTVDPPACEFSRTVTVSATAVATPGERRFAQAFPGSTPECRHAVARVMLIFREAVGDFAIDGATYSGTGTIVGGTRTVMDVAC